MTLRPGDGGVYVDSVPTHPDVNLVKRNVVISLEETVPGTSIPSGVVVGVASIHYTPGGGYGSDAEGVAHEQSDKQNWTRDVLDLLEQRYGAAGSEGLASLLVAGGDFNATRCNGGASQEQIEADLNGALSPSPDFQEWLICGLGAAPTALPKGQQPFYQHLQDRGFVDTVFAANAYSPSNTPGRFDAQYRDADRPNGRNTRIDYLFAQGATSYLGSSMDLSCGAAAGLDAGENNCTFLGNPHYYSDHRLVWALLGTNARPTVVSELLSSFP